jgi:hypothetical protein
MRDVRYRLTALLRQRRQPALDQQEHDRLVDEAAPPHRRAERKPRRRGETR